LIVGKKNSALAVIGNEMIDADCVPASEGAVAPFFLTCELAAQSSVGWRKSGWLLGEFAGSPDRTTPDSALDSAKE
jgi:hypothetical protein